MTAAPQILATVLLAALIPSAVPAQDEPEPPQRPSHRAGVASITRRGDVDELSFTGGVRYVDPRTGLDVRCDSALIVLDAQETSATVRTLQRESGLPRRGPTPPAPRRALDEVVLRARIDAFLAALQQRPVTSAPSDVDLELFRSIYLEGDVAVLQDGVEVLRADSIHYSPLDDRAVLRGVVLRLRNVTDTDAVPLQVTVRTDELVRQKGRFVGRSVSVTTCPAGQPQFEVISGELEILERPDAFEIRSRDNVLAFSRTPVLPLPDQSYVTGEQTNFPVKSASFGSSGREGFRAGVVVGGTFNDLGGAAHEALTGRPASEFRGDWQLGAQWIEERGFPLDGELSYRGGDVYSGEALGFYLDDQGENIRDIRRNLDGSPIDVDERYVVWTENRVRLGERTEVDLTLFDAGDPAVWSEFYRGRYYTDERPETSIHARHAEDNWIATATARSNLTGFAYDDARRLTPRFVEELPYLTLDWYAEPIAELPGETPLLLSTSTGIAQLRSAWDDTFATPVDDETWRVDQLVELAAPLHVGMLAVRPYADARFTWFEESAAGGSKERWALGAGVEFGTRMARSWRWGGDGGAEVMRHVMSPTVRFEHRYKVDVDPTELYQFDAVDEIDEGAVIRVGLLQRLQRRIDADGQRGAERELVWFDLAQNFTPISGRDNDGHHLGLLEFEFIFRPLRISENVRVGLSTEGEHDWNEDELRTLNNRIEVRTADVSWHGQYRTDSTASGQVVYGVAVPFRSRWTLNGSGVYDLEQKEHVRFVTQISRRDLNWTIRIGVAFDVVTDDTSLRILFEPSFGGLVNPRGMWGGLDDPFVQQNALGY